MEGGRELRINTERRGTGGLEVIFCRRWEGKVGVGGGGELSTPILTEIIQHTRHEASIMKERRGI